MSRTLQQITIFVSGTSEADSEKAALRRIIEELNRRLEKTHSVTLRVVGWPDDVRPGVNVDLQAEINRQCGSYYDIYVGILGTRFGTPTPRAGSGTEEEFEDALARFQTDSTLVRVLFYFRRCTEELFALNFDQLQRVRRFREALPSRGVLYRDFRDTADFTSLVQDHLYNLVIDEWQGQHWTSVLATHQGQLGSAFGSNDFVSTDSPASQSASENAAGESSRSVEADEDDEELGFLEYIAGFYEAVAAITEIMARISQDTERMGEQLRARTVEIDLIQQEHEKVKHLGGSRAQQELVEKARETADHAAANLDEFVAAMTPSVEQYRLQGRALFTNLRNGLIASSQFGNDNDKDNKDALVKLIGVMQASREQLGQFQSSISRVPALTGKFRRSRKRAAAILGDLIAEMSFSIDEAKRLLNEMGGEPDDNTSA